MRVLHVLQVFVMGSLDGQQSDRKCKMKFDPLELEVSVEKANKHIEYFNKQDIRRTKEKLAYNETSFNYL